MPPGLGPLEEFIAEPLSEPGRSPRPSLVIVVHPAANPSDCSHGLRRGRSRD